MEKIKRSLRTISIRLAFILTTTIFVLLATVATSKTNQWAFQKMLYISQPYRYNASQNDELIIVYEMMPTYDMMSKEDKTSYKLYQTIYRYSALVWYPLCIVTASLLFYQFKMKTPLTILKNASRKLADNDLNFQIQYDGQDELAQLCMAFEIMRSSVQQNHIAMWRASEERKRVNVAFAHDLRTPVTVMKGYADMLQKYMPEQKLAREKEIQTISKMNHHIRRLEQYIESMSAIQKLEDLEIQPLQINVNELIVEMKESATILCKEHNKRLVMDCDVRDTFVTIDKNILLQIYENLISNAVRFSQSKIDIHMRAEKESFVVCVHDDGKGFSREEFEMAKRPYYKGENTSANMHFGLGLYICNLLCKKHNGTCSLSNGENGGAVVTVVLKNNA